MITDARRVLSNSRRFHSAARWMFPGHFKAAVGTNKASSQAMVTLTRRMHSVARRAISLARRVITFPGRVCSFSGRQVSYTRRMVSSSRGMFWFQRRPARRSLYFPQKTNQAWDF